MHQTDSCGGDRQANNVKRISCSVTDYCGKTLDDVYKLAAKSLNASEKSLRDRYTHLNAGQQGMTLGNRIRAAAKKERK